jgi:hypothetical protein
MKDFLVLMHTDTTSPERYEDWEPFIGLLSRRGVSCRIDQPDWI